MDRAALVRAELERQKTIARAVSEAGPPCLSCRYSTIAGYCSNPAYYSQTFEPSRAAYSIAHDTPLERARSDEGLCGPEALLWEPQSTIRSGMRRVGTYMEAHPWQVYFSIIAIWGGLEWLF